MKQILCIVVACFLFSCGQKDHFLKDANYRKEVTKKFNERKELMKKRNKQLLDVFEQDKMTLKEKEALIFLYAYMPLNDLADYSDQYFLQMVKYAFKARETFPWGKTISDDNFRHFVLPYRINNENLDIARVIFFDELKERLKGMSMREAALEVNHWCHEKVTYRGADIRTSAPLATVQNALGRCGEESTFTVAAYRAAGIPARQVYTPRWAHCDDNHAWVEICVDGKWHYLGACEPEADLDLGWFMHPAKKAMLVHTKAFGKYKGKDRISYTADNYSELNLLEKYTTTKEISIIVKDENGNPVEEADVRYGVLNYSEFYPIVSLKTDKNGVSKFVTGLGDLFIWVNKGDSYVIGDIDVAKSDKLELTLSKNNSYLGKSLTFDLDPSKKGGLQRSTPPNAENDRRLKEEDKIRKAYEATFINDDAIFAFAEKVKIDKDLAKKYFNLSRGNHANIKRFIEKVSEDRKHLIFPLLENVSRKDLRDTPDAILLDNIENAPKNFYSEDIYYKYVLNPRVKNEILSKYRFRILNKLQRIFGSDFKTVPMNIKKWVAKHVKINEKENYYKTPITPVGVLELGVTDKEGRDILFVALCRSHGVASRLEPATLTPQYYKDGKWINVHFEKVSNSSVKYGTISFINTSEGNHIDPAYYKQFTIAKVENGKYTTLEFDFMKKLSKFDSKLEIPTGVYMVTTSNRKLNGGQLSKVSFIEVKENKDTKVNVEILKITLDNQVVCDLNLDKDVKTIGTEKTVNLKSLVKEKSMILGWIDPAKEPTRHAFVDFTKLKSEFEKAGTPIVLIVPKEKQTAAFDPKKYNIAKQTIFANDEKILKTLELKTGKGLHNNYPVFTIVKPNGDVIYLNKGYKIDIGMEMLKITKALDAKTCSKSCQHSK